MNDGVCLPRSCIPSLEGVATEAFTHDKAWALCCCCSTKLGKTTGTDEWYNSAPIRLLDSREPLAWAVIHEQQTYVYSILFQVSCGQRASDQVVPMVLLN